MQALFCDTAVEAQKVVTWYLQTGWQKIGLRSYRTTNYYSVVLRKPVCGRKYAVLEAWMYLSISFVICHFVFKRNGEIRLFAKPFYKIAYVVYRNLR